MDNIINGSENIFKKIINKKRQSKKSVLSTRTLHLMLIPSIIIVFIYGYLPMFGAIIAFQDFDVGIGGLSAFWQSKFVGFDNFMRLFGDADFGRALFNTFRIAILKITTMFFVPITVAILLNEIRKQMLKKFIQTMIYLPHFLSWIVLAGIIKDVFGNDGIINGTLYQVFGMQQTVWLTENIPFLTILITTNIWKEFGFSTIVYLAAITSVDPNLYEAAMIDGANRLKQIWHVTLPGMRPIIVLTGVLSLGGVLNAGFDQIYNLYSFPVYPVADVIDTIAFRKGFQGGDYPFGTALGLFNSTISLIMISTSYWLAKKFANYEIF